MTNRVVIAVAASLMPLALLQGCGEKNEKDTSTPSPSPTPETPTVDTPKPSNDISSLVQGNFKDHDRKVVHEFMEKTLNDIIEYDQSGVLARDFPRETTINVIAHKHGEGNKQDFCALDDVYSADDIRQMFTLDKGDARPEELAHPSKALTYNMRRNFIAQKNEVYIVDPESLKNNQDAKAVLAVFCSYHGDAPLKGDDNRAAQSLSKEEDEAQDKITLPMVVISNQSACARGNLFNYALAVITVENEEMQTCFEAAMHTFDIVKTVIAEARAREKDVFHGETNFNNYVEWKQAKQSDEPYNNWRHYTKTQKNQSTTPDYEQEELCGARMPKAEGAHTDKHMRALFNSLYKKVSHASNLFTTEIRAAKTGMWYGMTKFEKVKSLTDAKLLKAWGIDVTKDEQTKKADLLRQTCNGNSSTFEHIDSTGWYYEDSSALYYKFRAYILNAYCMHWTTADGGSLVKQAFKNDDGTSMEVDNRIFQESLAEITSGATGVDLQKIEPFTKAGNQFGLTGSPAEIFDTKAISDTVFHHDAVKTIMLDVAYNNVDELKKAVDAAVKIFMDIYEFNNPKEIESMEMQWLFAPALVHHDCKAVWMWNPENNQNPAAARKSFKPYLHELPIESESGIPLERAQDKKAYKSNIPVLLFDLIANEEGDKLKKIFPYFDVAGASKVRSENGFVEPVVPMHERLTSTLPRELFWSLPSKNKDVVVAMFLGMVKAFEQEYNDRRKQRTFFLGKAGEQNSGQDRFDVKRVFTCNDPKLNIPEKIILSSKSSGELGWEDVVKAASAAMAPAA